MAYSKPNILDPSVPGGDSVREAIDKNDENINYSIDAINNHTHDGEHGVPIAPGGLPDTVAYLTGANFTGDVQGPKIWARESLGTLGTLRLYDIDNQAVYAEGEMSTGAVRLVQKDGTGVIGGLKLRINDEEVPTASFFLDSSTGPNDGGKGVKLNPSGKIDESMLEIGGLTFIGSWTPTSGAEYPDTAGVEPGSFWMVSGVDSVNGYTFTGGDLAGQTAYNSDTMLWGSDGWMLKTVSVDPDMYYRLDGVSPITADFQAGGHKLVNVAEPTTDDDAATKYYVDTHSGEGGGGGINPVNEPQPGDFARFVTDMTQEGVTTGELENMLDFFKTTEFIHATTGAPDAFKPIMTAPTGYIDKSLMDISVFYFVGSFTPTSADEYPDTTGETPGAFWDVEGVHVDDGYTFTSGDLAGQTAFNEDLMMYGSGGWALRQSSLEPEMFYRLDGAYPLTGPFAGGGHQIKNISDGSDEADAITKKQLDSHDHSGEYLPISGTAANSMLLDGWAKSMFATATHNHDATYARLDGANFTGPVTVGNNFSVLGLAVFDNIPSTNGYPAYDNDLATKHYVDSLEVEDWEDVRLMEFGTNVPGDGACRIDFHASDTAVDYNFTVARNAGIDGSVSLHNTGTGGIDLYCDGGDINFFSSTGNVFVDGSRVWTDDYNDAYEGVSWEDVRNFDIGANVTGDGYCRIDFHTSANLVDYNFTIFRDAGDNGTVTFLNAGIGGMELYCDGGDINLSSSGGYVRVDGSRIWTDAYNEGGGDCDGCAMVAEPNNFSNTNRFSQEVIRNYPDSDNGFVVFQASYYSKNVWCGVVYGHTGWQCCVSSTTGVPPSAQSAPLYFVGDLMPDDPNQYDIGSSSYAWRTVYAGNVFNLSDPARMYSQATITNQFNGLIYDLEPVEFELIDQGVSDSPFLADIPPQQTGRRHVGILAQDVEDALTTRGLSAENFFFTDGETGNKCVNLTELVPLLINEIKLLESRITSLGG